MLIFKRQFSRFINNTPNKTARKKYHQKLSQYKYTPNNIINQTENNKLAKGKGLLNTFYESFIYGCGFFLSSRLLDQVFGPRYYDTCNTNSDNCMNEDQNNYSNENPNSYSNENPNSYSNENPNSYSNENPNSYTNENFLNNDPTIDDSDFQQDLGLDDDTFEF